jgi:hypothetical protein
MSEELCPCKTCVSARKHNEQEEKRKQIENIFNEVLSEIHRSEAKHGLQNDVPVVNHIKFSYNFRDSDEARLACDKAMALKHHTHAHIIAEEYHEFMDAQTPHERREELVQLACVVIKAIKALDTQQP